jgi:glycosyltransferase involved in cell wall biosynthesis
MISPASDNILMVVEQLRRRVPGGSGTYAAGIITGLLRLRVEGTPMPPVTLYASRATRDYGTSVDPIASSGLPLITSSLPGPVLTRGWDAGLLRAPSDFGVVHGVSLAVPRPAHSSARTIVTLHDLAWRQLPDAFPPRGRKWHERAFLRALRQGSEFVASSEIVGDQIREAGDQKGRTDANGPSVTVIPPGGDHLPEPDPAAAERILDQLGVHGPYLLSVGTLEPRKNLVALMDAYSKARGSLPEPWPLVIVGPQGWGPEVNFVEGVVPAGMVNENELSALYSKAHLLAFVPLLEGYGLPSLEAMHAGIPVVASPMPSIGDAALEVDPRNIDQIADGLIAVATDTTLRSNLVEAGRARAASLTWDACARRHIQLWQPQPPPPDTQQPPQDTQPPPPNPQQPPPNPQQPPPNPQHQP